MFWEKVFFYDFLGFICIQQALLTREWVLLQSSVFRLKTAKFHQNTLITIGGWETFYPKLNWTLFLLDANAFYHNLFYPVVRETYLFAGASADLLPIYDTLKDYWDVYLAQEGFWHAEWNSPINWSSAKWQPW